MATKNVSMHVTFSDAICNLILPSPRGADDEGEEEEEED